MRGRRLEAKAVSLEGQKPKLKGQAQPPGISLPPCRMRRTHRSRCLRRRNGAVLHHGRGSSLKKDARTSPFYARRWKTRKPSKRKSLARRLATMKGGGASVEWDKVFTWKDLSAPGPLSLCSRLCLSRRPFASGRSCTISEQLAPEKYTCFMCHS